MSKCGPRTQNFWCQGHQWLPCFQSQWSGCIIHLTWPPGCLWYSWWLHPWLFFSTAGRHILLNFLLCQWQFLLDVLCWVFLLSSNVWMLQAPRLSLQTFSYTYLSSVPSDLMALKPSLGWWLQNLYLQPDLSPRLQTHTSTCPLDIPSWTLMASQTSHVHHHRLDAIPPFLQSFTTPQSSPFQKMTTLLPGCSGQKPGTRPLLLSSCHIQYPIRQQVLSTQWQKLFQMQPSFPLSTTTSRFKPPSLHSW